MQFRCGLTIGFVAIVLVGVHQIYHNINLQVDCSTRLQEESFSHPTSTVAKKTETANVSIVRKVPYEAIVAPIPFLIGAGLGTTGTTSLFKAMCNLGFPSVHYKRSCTRVDLNSTIEGSLNLGVQAHRRMLKKFGHLKNCSLNSRKNNGTSVCPDYDTAASEMMKEVAAVVKSGLMFVTDTPYPFLVPYLRQVAKEEGLRDIVILTERDPKKWAFSRTHHHTWDADVMCENVDYAFDLQGCLQKEKDNAKLLFRHSELRGDSEYDNFLVDSMKIFQRTMKNQHPTMNINLWNEELLDIAHLQSALLHRMSHWVSPETLAYHSSAAALIEERRG